MIIPIDDDCRVRGDSYCWNLEYRQVPEKATEANPDREPYWRATGYFSSLATALHSAYRREVRTHPAETISTALEAAQQLLTKYAAIFDAAAMTDGGAGR